MFHETVLDEVKADKKKKIIIIIIIKVKADKL